MLINCSNLDSADHCVFIGTMKFYILEKIFFENWMCPFRYNYSYYYTLTRYQQILFNVYSNMYSLCKTTYVHPGVGANIWSPIVSKNCANVPTKCKGLSLIWLFAVWLRRMKKYNQNGISFNVILRTQNSELWTLISELWTQNSELWTQNSGNIYFKECDENDNSQMICYIWYKIWHMKTRSKCTVNVMKNDTQPGGHS